MAHVFRGHASDIEQGHPDYERLHTHDDDTRMTAGSPLRDNRPRKPSKRAPYALARVHEWRESITITETVLPSGNRKMLYDDDTIVVRRSVIAPTTDSKPTAKQIKASRRNGKCTTRKYHPPIVKSA